LLLHDGRADIRAVADRLWYPLWDGGVRIDHAVRRVDEARGVARTDLKAAVSLLDARHVAGDRALTDTLVSTLRADWRAGATSRLPELAALARRRAEAHGELAFLLEPDLKESAGGLRDALALQDAALAWAADRPGPVVRHAVMLLLDVRGELHRATGGRSDRFVAQEHGRVAQALGYADPDALRVAVASAGRAIGYASEQLWRRVGAPRTRWRRPQRRPLAAGVVAHGEEVALARDADPGADPVLVLRVAAAAAAAGLPIAAHTLDRLRGAAPLPQPWPAQARDTLVALLGAGRGAVDVLEAYDQAGLLVRLLPEWAAVRCRPQHSPVHRFTVDRHLIEAAVQAAALTRSVRRPDLLLLAALLHDIGKGVPGEHAAAGAAVVATVGRRLGLAADDVDVLVRLTRHHLLLADTATRRDPDDPATVATIVRAVADRDVLDLLAALTEADARATGPAAWTQWRASLVADLVDRVRRSLAGRPHRPPQVPVLPPGTDLPRVAVAPAGAALRVAVAAPDRPGLLGQAAGVLALHRLDVLAATAGADGATAVTEFTAAPRFGTAPEPTRLTADLRRALDGRLDVTALLRARDAAYGDRRRGGGTPATVRFDQAASATATVVEVRADDAAGLLHRLAATFAGCGYDVRAARVDTFGAEAVDAFYVTTATGGRIEDPAAQRRLSAALVAAAHG
jgi:[protein-PII] uridylyltransferase